MPLDPSKRTIELPQGPIQYRDEGDGPVIVFIHGYLVDGRLWDGVVERLGGRFRCIVPDLPLGAHRSPMQPDADLSPTGLAGLIAAFLDKLELNGVTIVGNDTGGALSQILATRHPERIARLVLTNCDTHENFPPGIFKMLVRLARLPGGLSLILAPSRIRPIGHATFRPFAKRLPDSLVDSWFEAGEGDAGVRRDRKKATVGLDASYTIEAARRLRDSDLPILLAWAPEDRFFPISYAERLAGEVRDAQMVRIQDSLAFVPIDQPGPLADAISDFVAARVPSGTAAS